jgi:phosphoribulokinase
MEPLSTFAKIAIVAVVASAATGAAAAISSGKQQKKMMQFNAEAARQEGDYRRKLAQAEVEDHRTRVARMQGANRAKFGEFGVLLEGSPFEVMMENERNSLLDEKRIFHQGEYAASAAANQSMMAKYKGDTAVTQSYYQAGSSILGGIGQGMGIAMSPGAKKE